MARNPEDRPSPLLVANPLEDAIPADVDRRTFLMRTAAIGAGSPARTPSTRAAASGKLKFIGSSTAPGRPK